MLSDYVIDLKKYNKLEKIDSGGYGQVYLIEKKESGSDKYVAKIFPNKKKNQKQQKSFMSEIETYSKIKYPAILNFIGYSLTDFDFCPNPTIITDYMTKRSLYDIITDLQLEKSMDNWNDTKKYISILGITLGMNYLHSNNIIHRDLKPGNILFDDNYYPRICDFGISKICESQLSDFLMKSQDGSWDYIAPEIKSNQKYTYKVDIYSFSIILYEIITLNKIKPSIDLTKIPGEENQSFIRRCSSLNPIERPNFSEICNYITTQNFIEIFNEISFEKVSTFLDIFGEDKEAKIIKNRIHKILHKNDDNSLFVSEMKTKPETKNSTEMNKFAVMLRDGDGIDIDKAEAARYFKMASEKGNDYAMYNYANMLLNGDGIQRDKKEAARYFQMSSNKGNDRSMNKLATMLRKGDGIPSNKKEAAHWYLLASNKGNDTAMNNLASMFRDGDGIEQNKNEAFRYFKLAADKGNHFAMNNLAMMLKKGDGIEQNKSEAIRYFKLAADKGNNFAMNNLAMMFRDGDGIEQNKSEALRYFKMAADKGNEFAMSHYASMIFNGDNEIQSNKKEAARYFKMAADLGNDYSMFCYANLKFNGDGVEMDKKEAIHYYEMAAEKGNLYAIKKLNLLNE